MKTACCTFFALGLLAGGARGQAVFTLETEAPSARDAAAQNERLFGRRYTPQYLALGNAGPFRYGIAGGAANLAAYGAPRYGTVIEYVTPALRGLRASALYSYGEAPYSSASNRVYGAALDYADGALKLSVTHQRKDSVILADTGVAVLDTSARNTLLAANFRAGRATVYAGYGVNKGPGSSPWDPANPYAALALGESSRDSRDALLGLAVPVGSVTLLASLIRKHDLEPAGRDASQLAIGLSAALSRRDVFYASYAKIHNRNGAAYTVGGGDSAINFGLRHGF